VDTAGDDFRSGTVHSARSPGLSLSLSLLAGLQKTRGNRKLRLASESITRYLSNAGPTRARSKRFVRCGDFFRICDVARRQNGPFLMAPAWHSKDISVVKGSANNSLSAFNSDCLLHFDAIYRAYANCILLYTHGRKYWLN
jgi:hypothetical protein